MKVTKTSAACVGDLRLSAIDVGFDIRAAGKSVRIPDWEFRSVGLDDRKGNRLLIEGTREELIAAIRAHGYQIAE